MRIGFVASILGYLLVAGGCARRQQLCIPAAPVNQCVDEHVAPRVIAPQVIPAAVERLPTTTEQYIRLGAFDCQCRAVRAAPLADLVALERRMAMALTCCETSAGSCRLQLQQRLLALRAEEHRNRAAGMALSAFGRLAQVEGGRQILKTSLAEIEHAISRSEELRGSVLLKDFDPSSLDRQRLALLGREEELRLAADALNDQLHVAMGCPPDEHLWWPDVDWTISAPQVEIDTAVAVGLESRADLRALRLTLRCLDQDTLPIAKAVLATADASLGTAARAAGTMSALRCGGLDCDEVRLRRAQLQRLLASSENTLAATIRQAVRVVHSRYERAALASRVVDSRRGQYEALLRRRQVDNTSVLRISRARLELLEAQHELVQQVGELLLADAQLRQTQGLLARECGVKDFVSGPEVALKIP